MLQPKTLFFCSFFFFTTILSSAQVSDNLASADTLREFVLPNITITAERDFESIKAKPISQITRSHIARTYTTNDLPLVISELPSVYSYSQNGNGIGYSTLSLRGFDQRRIAVNINGIPQNDPEDHNVYWIDFPDLTANLELIEVQRGAGDNNFGFSSIGGSINLVTSNFVLQKGVKLFSGLGFQEFSGMNSIKHNITKQSIEASSGLLSTDNGETHYSIYARLSQINSFGYRHNSFAELNSYFLGIARFDDKLATQINIFGGPLRDGLAYYGIPKQYCYDPNLRLTNYNYWSYDSTGKNVSYYSLRRPQEIEEFSQPHFEILNDLSLNENINIKSSLFYYTGKGYFDYDGTGWTTAESFELNEKNGYPNAKDPQNPIIRAFVDNEQFGWIPSITFNQNSYKLKLGGEIRFHNSVHWGKINYADNLPENYNPDFKFYSYEGKRIISSIYGSYYKTLLQNLALKMDAQLVYHNYAIHNDMAGNHYRKFFTTTGEKEAKGELFNVNYIFFNPRIGIEQKLDNHKFFGFVAITSREPRMANLYQASEAFVGKTPQFYATYDSTNNRLIYDFTRPLVKPETMYDFELGYNYSAGNLSVNTNLYYMMYRNELVKSGQLDLFGDPIDGNAPRTHHLGLEISARYEFPIFGDFLLGITANSTISQNKIDEYKFELGSGESISLNGNDIAGFPSLLGNLRISLHNNSFYASIYYQYVGSYRTDNFGDLLVTDPRLKSYLGWDYYTDNTLDSFGIINMDLNYKLPLDFYVKNLVFQAKINNLTNKLYAAGAEGKEFFPGAERNFFLGIGLEF